MVKFFETYGEFYNFDEEIFPCELVVSSHTFPNLIVKNVEDYPKNCGLV